MGLLIIKGPHFWVLEKERVVKLAIPCRGVKYPKGEREQINL